jgi:hypothetical protein
MIDCLAYQRMQKVGDVEARNGVPKQETYQLPMVPLYILSDGRILQHNQIVRVDSAETFRQQANTKSFGPDVSLEQAPSRLLEALDQRLVRYRSERIAEATGNHRAVDSPSGALGGCCRNCPPDRHFRGSFSELTQQREGVEGARPADRGTGRSRAATHRSRRATQIHHGPVPGACLPWPLSREDLLAARSVAFLSPQSYLPPHSMLPDPATFERITTVPLLILRLNTT